MQYDLIEKALKENKYKSPYEQDNVSYAVLWVLVVIDENGGPFLTLDEIFNIANIRLKIPASKHSISNALYSFTKRRLINKMKNGVGKYQYYASFNARELLKKDFQKKHRWITK